MCSFLPVHQFSDNNPFRGFEGALNLSKMDMRQIDYPKMQGIARQLLDFYSLELNKADARQKPLMRGYLDEVPQQIPNENIRKMLRQELGLIKNEDLICDFSQGDETRFVNGKAACTCISWCAAEYFLSGKSFESSAQMDAIMAKGVKKYSQIPREQKDPYTGKIIFQQLVPYLKDDQGQPLSVIIPKVSYVDPSMMPILEKEGAVNGDAALGQMEIVLNALVSEAKDKPVCGVMTARGETIVIAFAKGSNKPCLFDSHGTHYLGRPVGASVLAFDSVNALSKHLSEEKFEFNKPHDDGTFFLMSVVTKKFNKPASMHVEPTHSRIVKEAPVAPPLRTFEPARAIRVRQVEQPVQQVLSAVVKIPASPKVQREEVPGIIQMPPMKKPRLEEPVPPKVVSHIVDVPSPAKAQPKKLPKEPHVHVSKAKESWFSCIISFFSAIWHFFSKIWSKS